MTDVFAPADQALAEMSWDDLFDEYDRVFSLWLRDQVRISALCVRLADLEAQVQEMRA